MRKWVTEDWQFELTATEGSARSCRLGIERGNRFVFSYGCPEGICPRVMMEVLTWCEVIRCGGDFTCRGEKERYQMDLTCPCAHPLSPEGRAGQPGRSGEAPAEPSPARGLGRTGRADCHLAQGVL